MVQMRSSKRQADIWPDENNKLQNKNKEPNVYEVINNNDVKKFVNLKFNNHKCLFKHGKRIISPFLVNDFYSKGKFDLGQFFSRLNSEAGLQNIVNIKLSPSEQIFEFVSLNEFKNMGNKVSNVEIALLTKVTKIDKNDKSHINAIMSKYYDEPFPGGHTGITRTLIKIKRFYYWPGMRQAITKYVKHCDKCQRAKVTTHTKEPMIVTQTPITAFDTVLIDTIGPLPRSVLGNEYAITIICDLTKYLVTIPVADKSAGKVARAIFESFVLKNGPMKTFITDMDTE